MAQQMNVSKRRLYDIAHVMEGAGMMTRSSKGKNVYIFRNWSEKPNPKNNSKNKLDSKYQFLEQQEVQVQEYMSHLELLT